MKIASKFWWGAVTIEVAVPDPSMVSRPEKYGAIQKAVDKLAALIREALDDDALISPDDKTLELVRPDDG